MREELTEPSSIPPELMNEEVAPFALEADRPHGAGKRIGKRKFARKKKAKSASKPKELEYPEDFEGIQPPTQIKRNRRIGELMYEDRHGEQTKGLLHLPGVSHNSDISQCEIMFISPQVLKEEMSTFGGTPAGMLKGAPGSLFNRNLLNAGFHPDYWYYTSVVKYQKESFKFSKKEANWGWPALLAEIQEVKPLMIVCLGKKVFDLFCPLKLNADDVQGAFFWHPEFQCSYTLMDVITRPLQAPEHIERFLTDARNVYDEWISIRQAQHRVSAPVNKYYLNKLAELKQLCAHIKSLNAQKFAVDCEWKGQTYVDGQLRMFQFAWSDSDAAVCHFYDMHGQWMWDCTINEVAAELQDLMNPAEVRFSGHNIAADAPWMKHHLGIDTKNRVYIDTMFARHTVHEGADFKLERMSVQYTDCGRYDIDLTLWKKAQGKAFNEDDGYGSVPDEILLPYAALDVIVTFRIAPIIEQQLRDEGVYDYYYQFIHPFVTTGFGEMMECGLPIGIDFLNEMREVYNRNSKLLAQEFRRKLQVEAEAYFYRGLQNTFSEDYVTNLWTRAKLNFDARLAEMPQEELYANDDLAFATGPLHDEIRLEIQTNCPTPETTEKLLDLFDHWWCAPVFKINGTNQIRRWLFQVKEHRPIKTTKKDGIQMGWDKVLELEPDKQRLYLPAADKQTLKVFAEWDDMVGELQDLKGVANIVKAFLPDADEDGRERGLHKWIQQDGCVHANFSLTETARPRTWKPNILNWPKYITKPIEKAFDRANQLDPAFQSKPSSLRAAVQAPPGWVFVDMDLKTAEIFGLAYLSGDSNMIQVLTSKDLQFGFIGEGDDQKRVRIAYTPDLSAYPESEWDQTLIVSPDQVNRDRDGQIIHPKRDLHWELAETVAMKPREKLDEDADRGGVGKVGNFCLLEDTRILTQRGQIAIQDVLPDDLLWDGVEWVPHEGVICTGVKETHLYQGLRATDEHEVWIEEKTTKVPFGEARHKGWTLRRVQAPPAETAEKVEVASAGSAHGGACGERSLRDQGNLPAVQQDSKALRGRDGTGQDLPVLLRSTQGLQRPASLHITDTLRRYASTLRERFSRLLRAVQGTRDQGVVQVSPGVCRMGAGEMARHGLQGSGVRQEGQQWALLEGKPSSGDQVTESAEPNGHRAGNHRGRASMAAGTSAGGLHCDHDSVETPTGDDYGADHRAVREEQGSRDDRTSKGYGEDHETQVGKVYDILNVGPRHRYVAEGVLVSNSIPYGASGKALERLIEANVGKKPEEGTGERMVNAYMSRYPIAAEFLEQQEKVVTDPGYYVSVSGRKRRFFTANMMQLDDLSDYTRRGILSGMLRQSRNFPMQNLVAETTSSALVNFVKYRDEWNMQARIMMLLYDAMTGMCPLEELKQTTHLMEHCLTVGRPWVLNGMDFHFQVDLSLCFRWGVKMTPEEKEMVQAYL